MKVYKNEKKRAQVLESYARLVKLSGVPVKEEDYISEYGSTHLLIAGDKGSPPLILFHGVGDNSAVMWFLNLKDLSQKFYCVAVDTLGGPGKSVPKEGLVKENFDQVKWIDGIADYCGFDKFYVAGVSNGAYMTYNYTTKRKDRVIRAVCLEGGMLLDPIKSMVKTLMLMFPEILIPTDTNMKRIIKKLSTPYSDIFEKHPEIIDHMIMVLRAHNRKAMFIHTLNLYNREEGLAVRDKLLFLIGGFRVKKMSPFLCLLKEDGYNYKVIQNCGHGINMDRPDIIDGEIISFLLGRA